MQLKEKITMLSLILNLLLCYYD